MHKNKCLKCGLVYYDPLFFGDNKFYEKLSQQKWYYEDDKWEFYEAIKLIEKYQPRSILEIGCGTGMFLGKISSMMADVDGYDINEDAVKTCKEKGLNVSIADISSKEFPQNHLKKYDMIVLFEVLEHLEKPKEIFDRLDSMLSDDGLLLIAVPNPEGYLKNIDIVLLDMPPHHNTVWSQDVFIYLAKNKVYETIYYNTEPLRYVHYLYYLLSLSQSFSRYRLRLLNNVFKALSTLIIRLMAPFYFTSDRQTILGQTHLVLLKKSQI